MKKIYLSNLYFSNIYLFIALFLLMGFGSYISYNIIITDNLVFRSLNNDISTEQIVKMLKLKEKFKWLIYISPIIFSTLKISIVSFVLLIGAFLNDYKIDYKQLWRISLLAEIILVLINFVRLYIASTVDFQSLSDVNNFHPLSIFSLFNDLSIPSYLIYLLTTINIFNLIYWLSLITLLAKVFNISFFKGTFFFFKTYGASFLLWFCLITFLTIK